MDWLVVSLERPFTIKIFKSGRLHLPTPGQPLGGGVGQRNGELFGSQSLRSRRVLIKVILGDFRGRLWSKDVIQHLQTTFLLLKFDPLLFPSVGIWPNLGYFSFFEILFTFFLLLNHCFLCVKDLNVKKKETEAFSQLSQHLLNFGYSRVSDSFRSLYTCIIALWW